MPILETRNLSKIYPGVEPVVALNRVNLTLSKGEHIAVVGDSGSGSQPYSTCLGEWTNPLKVRSSFKMLILPL